MTEDPNEVRRMVRDRATTPEDGRRTWTPEKGWVDDKGKPADPPKPTGS